MAKFQKFKTWSESFSLFLSLFNIQNAVQLSWNAFQMWQSYWHWNESGKQMDLDLYTREKMEVYKINKEIHKWMRFFVISQPQKVTLISYDILQPDPAGNQTWDIPRARRVTLLPQHYLNKKFITISLMLCGAFSHQFIS